MLWPESAFGGAASDANDVSVVSMEEKSLPEELEERIKETEEWLNFYEVMELFEEGCYPPTVDQVEEAVRHILSNGRIRIQTMKTSSPLEWYPQDTPPRKIARDMMHENGGNLELNMFSCVVDAIPGVSR